MFFIKWWSCITSLLILSFQFYRTFFHELSMSDLTNEQFSFSVKSNSVLSSSQFLICWLFWKRCPTNLIPLTDNEELKIVLSSILTYSLSHKYCEATVKAMDGRDGKCFPHFIKVSWYYARSSLNLLGLMHKFELNIKFFLYSSLIKRAFFILEYCKLVNLFGISVLLRPSFL